MQKFSALRSCVKYFFLTLANLFLNNQLTHLVMNGMRRRGGPVDFVPNGLQHLGECRVDDGERRRRSRRDIDFFHQAKWMSSDDFLEFFELDARR